MHVCISRIFFNTLEKKKKKEKLQDGSFDAQSWNNGHA